MYFVEKIISNKYWDNLKIPSNFDTENSIFFDIETTGLSPASSFVFLIGLAFLREQNIVLRQYFANNKSEEKDILDYFIEDLKHFTTLYHFNGLSFDIPFVNARLSDNNVSYQIDKSASIDIYKILKNNKDHFGFQSLKLQNIEKDLGIFREDDLSGKEVADSYKEYASNMNHVIRDKILLHNEEDIINLFQIVPLLCINDTSVLSSTLNFNTFIEQNNVRFNGTITLNLNDNISVNHNDIMFTWCPENNNFSLVFPIKHGELYYFLKKYKEYYYIPEIDQCVHKTIIKYYKDSVKEPATPDNCYTKLVDNYIELPILFNSENIKICSSDSFNSNSCITIDELNKNIGSTELTIIIDSIIQNIISRL